MSDILMPVQVIDADNNKVRSLFDIMSLLLIEFDCSKKDSETALKFITQLNTLVNYGEHLSTTLKDNITKLWHTLRQQITEQKNK